MPGIVDDLVTPDLAWVVGDHLVAQQYDDAFGMGAHQHHSPRARCKRVSNSAIRFSSASTRSGVSSIRRHRSQRFKSSTISGAPDFSHASFGMKRFPSNIEQLTVQRDSTVIWFIARRNDTELRFPLNEDDQLHLARLLLDKLMPPV